MRRRSFLASTAASLLAAMTKVGQGRMWAAEIPKKSQPGNDARTSVEGLENTNYVEPVEIPGSWQPPLPAPRANFGVDPLFFETSFQELRPARLAPVNTKTTVGLPGWPVVGFGHLMRSRYSEFQMRFSVERGGQERMPHTLANFRQRSPGDWLPGAISEWDEGGVHYRVSYIVAPNDPQPLDLYEIVLKNNGPDEVAQGHLLVTLDGAETMKAEGDLIGDRGKPLLVMDPVVLPERIARDAGCVDPRATPSGTWGYPSMKIDEWRTHRDGWYGMPIEYRLRVKPGASLQVFLGFGGTPQPYTGNWDIPLNHEEPDVAAAYKVSQREIVATVEGDAEPQQLKLGIEQRVVLKFSGKDTDGDGYIKLSVRATSESRQPAVLALIWAFDPSDHVSVADLLSGEPTVRLMPGTLSPAWTAPPKSGLKPKYYINVGQDQAWDISSETLFLGKDSTAFALRLRYEPKLACGEEKRYELRLPAIDKPEMAPYGNPWRPYDTGESWKPYMDPRHPENRAPYGEEVPTGTDPAHYSIYGPKPREVWDRQLVAARKMTWESGMERLRNYWNEFVTRAAQFVTPEPYLDHLYKHQLAVLAIQQIYLMPSHYLLQMVGPDWYWDALASRDDVYIARSWDLAGFHDVAANLWRTMLTPRSELPASRWTLGQWVGDADHDGLWLTRSGQWDGQGQVPWAVQTHYRLTGDRAWLTANYAALVRGAEWMIRGIEREKARLGNPAAPGYGLLPVATGEAGGPGHNFYVNSFAVLGLRNTAATAAVLGHREDAERFQAEAVRLQSTLHSAIRNAYVRYNDFAGTISQSVEWRPDKNSLVQTGGERHFTSRPTTDFGCPLVWPTEALGPFDPLMDSWFHNREQLEQDTAGLFDWLYIAADMGISYIRRGEGDRAADWFYVYVNHASLALDWGENVEAHSTFPEFGFPRKGIRTEGQMPHGWSSAMYISYLRQLMLHEEGEVLHIAPATPRKWLAQPHPIGVEGAPSEFGPVTYRLTADPDRTTVRGQIQLDANRKPKRLLVHIRPPGGRGLKQVKVNGKNCDSFDRETIVISEPPERMEIEAVLLA